jgi:hypothetical protein
LRGAFCMPTHPLTMLCLASYEKGAEFMREAKRQGWRVYLVTSESIRDAAWPRESLDDIFLIPDENKKWRLNDVILGVSYLARTHCLDRIVALDDFDVERAAALREHLRVPGMGETTARYFRDKLAMRARAREYGVPVPPFTPVFNDEVVNAYLAEVPGPWLVKPRSEASTIGIKRTSSPDEVWEILNQLGDRRSYHLLEKFLPGDVYHVDSIVSEREVVFAAVSKYARPPIEVMHDGDVFATRTVEYGSEDEQQLLEFNRRVLKAMGLVRGASPHGVHQIPCGWDVLLSGDFGAGGRGQHRRVGRGGDGREPVGGVGPAGMRGTAGNLPSTTGTARICRVDHFIGAPGVAGHQCLQ